VAEVDKPRSVDQAHLRKLCRSGKATVVPASTMAGFADVIEALPWSPAGTGLDWGRIDGSELELSGLDRARLKAWLSSVALGRDTHVVFWLGTGQPCIACLQEFGIVNLDQVLWRLPGRRYLCGASLQQGEFAPEFTHFAEYDGADWLRASR
jgi:hypothetical protein